MIATNTLIDFHTHAFQYAGDLELTPGGAIVATSRATEYRLGKAAISGRDDLDIGIGMHPQLAGSLYEPFEREVFEAEYKHAGWISEVGLDGFLGEGPGPEFGGVADAASQSSLFNWVLGLVDPGQRISVHSRGAEQEVRLALATHGLERVVYHNYGGDPDALRASIEAGSYFSINPWMFATDEGRSICRAIPIDRVLLETDGPFLKRDDQSSASVLDLPLYASQLAGLRAMPEQDLVDAVLENQARFLMQ